MMGIVVTIAMLLGLIVFIPKLKYYIKIQQGLFIGCFLLFAGLWNSLWFGLRHWQVFWGYAAIISGVAMVLASVLILKDYKDSFLLSKKWLNNAYTLLYPLRAFIVVVLFLSFLLYTVTLVRLNLGMSIIS